MILSLNVGCVSPIPGFVPHRRRAIVLGATEAGVSAAFHLGKMATLIEQRDFASAERKALYEVTSGAPPQLHPTPIEASASWDDVWRQVVSLMSGEVRLGSVVTAIDSAEHRLQLATGECFIYDKLVCTLRLPTLQRLLIDEQPECVRGPDWWRCWLGGRDIELLDEATQIASGDLDGEAAGKRMADSVTRAMREKYSRNSLVRRQEALFQPKLVRSRSSAAP